MAPMIKIIKVIGYGGRRYIITISFGKNPVSGGSPLIDKIIKGIIIRDRLYEDIAFCSWD